MVKETFKKDQSRKCGFLELVAYYVIKILAPTIGSETMLKSSIKKILLANSAVKNSNTGVISSDT